MFDRFQTTVTLYETPKITIVPNQRDFIMLDSLGERASYRRKFGYYGGIRLIEAIIARFYDYCEQKKIHLENKNFTIEYSSTIPFGLGLGGSSAIIKPVLTALMRFFRLTDKEIPKAVQPNLILEAETKELDISAGPQDRVVVVYGGLVSMDFTEDAYAQNQGLHGRYKKLKPELLPPLFIAYKEELTKSSGKVHNIMRYRVSEEHDRKVLDVMKQKAALVEEAEAQLLTGNKQALGPIISRDFDLRSSVYTISPDNMKLIEIARSLGAHAKQTGSGGAAIGSYEDETHYRSLENAYSQNGFTVIKVNVVDY